MSDRELILEWLAGTYAVCRLDAAAGLPAWAIDGLQRGGPAHLVCVTRTDSELALVIDESLLTQDRDSRMAIQRGFVAMRVAGTLDFALVGILAKLTSALAAAGIPVFVLSTFDTDIILLRAEHANLAVEALRPVAGIAQRKEPGSASKEAQA